MKTCHSIQTRELTQIKSDGTRIHLTYNLMEHRPEESPLPLYGIRVRLREDNAESCQEVMTPPISGSDSFVLQLLDKIARCAVTPTCLLEVLDEQISLQEDTVK